MKENIEMVEIIGFPGYKITNSGEVYSFKTNNSWNYSANPRKLKQFLDGKGNYFWVGLRKDKKTYQKNIHVLVLETFVGPRPLGHQASHLNGNEKDNRLHNLVWESPRDNLMRKRLHGTGDVGVNNSRALFNLDQIKQIRKWLSEGITAVEIAKRMGCNGRDIGKIKRVERYAGQGV